ncbi:MAG: ATPase [Euryarchaeota archaeon]|nr:ATPase [Euryarchaeota archaeon]
MTSTPAGRLSTGVPGLDGMMGGGLLPGDSTLVAGSPGTGKTTLGLHYLAAGVQAGQPGVFVTFEYLPQQIYRDAEKKGWDLKQWEAEDKARLVCTTPKILLADSAKKGTVLDQVVGDIGAQRLFIDSMSHFEFTGMPSGDLRERISGLMNHLRLLKVTTVMTHEIAQIVGPAVTISNYGIEFLVDNIVVLRYVELEGELRKALNVLKFRGGGHDKKYRVLELTDEGMVVKSDFAGVENISLGSARRTVKERAQRLV